MTDIPKKKWIIYLLECGDKSLYCGITNNLDRRLKQHNGEINGGAKYTQSRKPLKIVYQENAISRAEALKREITIKRMSKKSKKNLISNNYKN